MLPALQNDEGTHVEGLGADDKTLAMTWEDSAALRLKDEKSLDTQEYAEAPATVPDLDFPDGGTAAWLVVLSVRFQND